MHAKKTGALIRASALLGGFAAGIKTEDDPRMQDAALYAENIGLAFQVIDDILDATSDNETLGKPVHSDVKQEKTTFLSEMSIEDAFAYAKEKTENAIRTIEKYENNEILVQLAKYLLERKK